MFYDLLQRLEQIFRSSPIAGLGVSYVAGILVSFSPCIYPLIPITLGVIGATKAHNHVRGLTLSAFFVLGICVTYTTLGIVASFFGVLFSNFFLNPFSYALLALIFVFFGLSLFDVIRMKVPMFAFDIPLKRQGVWLFVAGLASGLAIIPCNYPVLGAILALISRTHNIAYGGTCLFFFSLGYGSVLILLGTFSSLIAKLPKQGRWLSNIRKVIGIIFFVMAIYFIKQMLEVIR